MQSIDLNADLGETEDETAAIDVAILEFVTSANVSCGAHAGSPSAIAATVQAALKRNVAIGAHPAYPDRHGFGREALAMPPKELRSSLVEQIGWLSDLVSQRGGRLRYVKPHGALYHEASKGEHVCHLILDVAEELGLPLLGMADSPGEVVAKTRGVRWVREGFADRRYEAPGVLAPRSAPHAVYVDRGEVLAQVDRMLTGNVESICLHGDTPGARELARIVRTHLEEQGVATGPVV